MNEINGAGMGLSGPLQRTGDAPVQANEAQDKLVQPQPEGEEQAKSLVEMMQEAKEKAEECRDRFKLKKDGAQYGDAAMMAYARLARARNQAEVNSAAGYARRRIVQFQAALRSDSDNAERIKAAIRQLQKAVGRARKKGRDLDREKLIRARQIKAQKAQERRKAAQLNQELNRKKTMRVIRESGYLREAEIDNRLQAQLAQTRLELRTQAEKLAASMEPSVEAALRQYTVQATSTAPAPAPEAGLDIQI